MERAIKVNCPLGPDAFVFRNMTGTESLGRLFEYEIEVLNLDPAVKLEDVIGQPMTIEIEFASKEKRYFHGEVAQFRQLTRSYDKYTCYEAILRPTLWYLTRTKDCRIFQEKSVPEIVEEILKEHGITNRRKALTGTYQPLEYCVQYDETDFNFISRLMESVGIYYFFEHASGKHTLVLADGISAHKPIAGDPKLPFSMPKPGYSMEYIFNWEVTQKVETGTVALTDYDFEKPKAKLEAKHPIKRKHANSALEAFHYPGNYTDANTGKKFAQVRIEELQSSYELVWGSSNSPRLFPGSLFKLDEYVRRDQNVEHLVIEQKIEVEQSLDTQSAPGAKSVVGVSYRTELWAIKSQTPFRAASTTPKPHIQGPQTAVVVGKEGEEIFTDKYGRIKVQFHWDRYGKRDEKSSCWVRVAHAWAAANWGAFRVPRIGEEVIVDFLGGDPDAPLVTGCVYNADNMPPYALPTNQTRMTLKTRSTKKGSTDNFNELRFEDLKDKEEVYFHAERDFNRVVENNDTLKVGFDKKDPGNQTIEIYNDRTTTVEKGNEKLQVKTGNRETLVDKGNDSHGIAKGNREVTIDTGNDTLTIKTGNHTIKISSGKSTIEAAQSIELKVGGSSIKISPTSIEMKSTMIKLQGQAMVQAQGNITSIKGSAMVEVNGGIVKIN